MAPTETIEHTTAAGPRLTGSDADRATTDRLTARLESFDREVEVDQLRVRPDHHVAHALHLLIAVAGTLVSTASPPLGVVIVLFAAASMYLDLTARFYIVRNILPRRRTRNLTLQGPKPDARACLLITAHHDSGRSGLLYGFGARLPRPLARFAGPIDIAFWTVAIALLLCAARILLGGTGLITGLQLAIAILLLAETLLFADAAFAKPSPGASSNGSGVDAALELAERFQQQPARNIDVWVVLTGAGEGLMLGMREWLAKRESMLRRRMQLFVNLDTLGQGTPRYVTAEGYVAPYLHDQHLIEQCEQLAAEFEAKPQVLRRGTDGVLPAIKGHPSITICCLDAQDRTPNFHSENDTEQRLDLEAIDRATDFAEALIRRIDAQAPAAPKERKRSRRKAKAKPKPKPEPAPQTEPEDDQMH